MKKDTDNQQQSWQDILLEIIKDSEDKSPRKDTDETEES